MKGLLQKKILRFLLLGGGLYVAWLLLYFLVIQDYTKLDYWVNYNIAEMGQAIFSIFGVESYIEVESDHIILLLDPLTRMGVWIGDECNGVKLWAIFAILIIILPGNKRSKFWFIPVGILLIHFINVIRIVCLLAIYNSYPEALDFNHKYTYVVIVYGLIFFLWWWWAKKYGLKSEQKD